jgi:HK97 family phage portal protein
LGILDTRLAQKLVWNPGASALERMGFVKRQHPGWSIIRDELKLGTSSSVGTYPLDQNYEKFLKSVGFFTWVQACVKANAKAMASAPLFAEDPKTGELTDDHPLVEKMNNPNPQDGGFKFRLRTAQQLLLTGEAFWAMDGSQKDLKDLEFWLLRSDRMGIEPSGSDAFPVSHYVFRNAHNDTVDLDPERVLHFAFPHPTDPLHGLSPLHELRMTLSLLWKALQWNKDFFDNGARLSGLLKVQGELSETEYKRAEAKLREKHGKEGRRHRAMILEGGADWIETGTTPKEADFLDLLRMLRDETHAVIGTPPIRSGILEYASYANAVQQDKGWYRGSIIPDNKLIFDDLNAQPVVLLQGVKLIPNYDDVEALQDDRNEISEMDVRDAEVGIRTINQIREERGYGEPVPWGNAPRWAVEGGFVDLEGAPIDEDDDEEEEPEQPTDPPPEETPEPADDEGEPTEEGRDLGPVPIAWLTHPIVRKARDLRYRQFILRTTPLRLRWQRAAKRLFVDLEKEVARTLSQLVVVGGSAPLPPELDGARLFRPEMFVETAHALFDGLARATMQQGGDDVYAIAEGDGLKGVLEGSAPSLKQAGDVYEPDELWLETWTGNAVSGMNTTQQKKLAKIVGKSLREGESVDTLARGIKGHFRTMKTSHARMIARTETISLYNAGSVEGMLDVGYGMKEWLATPDDLTRDSHNGIDGTKVPVAEDFHLDGGSGPFPGAISGGAEENANCRCSVIPVIGS